MNFLKKTLSMQPHRVFCCGCSLGFGVKLIAIQDTYLLASTIISHLKSVGDAVALWPEDLRSAVRICDVLSWIIVGVCAILASAALVGVHKNDARLLKLYAFAQITRSLFSLSCVLFVLIKFKEVNEGLFQIVWTGLTALERIAQREDVLRVYIRNWIVVFLGFLVFDIFLRLYYARILYSSGVWIHRGISLSRIGYTVEDFSESYVRDRSVLDQSPKNLCLSGPREVLLLNPVNALGSQPMPQYPECNHENFDDKSANNFCDIASELRAN